MKSLLLMKLFTHDEPDPMQSARRRGGYLARFGRLNAAEEDEVVRCDLHVFEEDEGAGESVDPDSVVPTVGAN
jgi:hypothetical protein